MNTNHIIVKTTQTEVFTLNVPGIDGILTLSLDQEDEHKMLRNSILAQLEESVPRISNVMYDFLHFALAVYTIDQTVSRQINGFQGWSRHIKVYFPVNDLLLWEQVREPLERYVGFLSGDRWEFFFRQNAEVRVCTPQSVSNPENYTKVSLLSGGLDSLVAAIDLLTNSTDKPMFVSHYKTGTESNAQDKVLKALQAKYGNGNFSSFRFYVQPNQKNSTAQKENSSRARSLLFISLGLTVANDLGALVPLILPENGLISLNVPLTKTRLSSHSTRTTHPYFVDGLNKITALLGIQNRIINPYRFKTKGEMMLECSDAAFLQEITAESISCSHPEQSRYAGKRPGLNCGYCVPCIIRQAAEYKAGGITTEYGIDDVRHTPPSNKKTKGADYRAFNIALERLGQIRHTHSLALEIIRSGPIPDDPASPFSEYVEVYKRGMAEVKTFLNS